MGTTLPKISPLEGPMLEDSSHDDEKRDEILMPVWGHLDELRKSIIQCLIALFVGVLITYWFSEKVVLFLEQPLKKALPSGASHHLYFTGVSDKFIVYLKVSLLMALVLVFPYILFQLWRFVSPALYRNEKRFLTFFILSGSLAFLIGLIFGYGVILPVAYHWLLEFGSPEDKPWITLTDYFGLTFKILFSMGILFEVPILMGALGWMGVIDWRMLQAHRKYTIFGSSIAAAVLTPTNDVLTMLIVFGVLVFLFEIGLLGMRFVSRVSH